MWKDYFSFTRGERNGIIVLVVLIFVVTGAKELLFLFRPNAKEVNFEKFVDDIEKWENTLKEKDNLYYENRLNRYIIERYDSIDLFPFDPNTVKREELLKLGFTKKQAKNIVNYRERGGKFIEKDDFKKIYGIRLKQFEIVAPYIKIKNPEQYKKTQFAKTELKQEDYKAPDSLFNFNPNLMSDKQMQLLGFSAGQIQTIQNYRSKGGRFYKKSDLQKIYGINENQYNALEPFIEFTQTKDADEQEIEEEIIVEVNSCDSASLMQIKGLKAYQARNIIKYREILGGFVSKEQLREVYGIKEYTYNKIAENLEVTSGKIRKLNINFSEVKELIKHPYLDYAKAKDIIEYRTKNGSYKNIETLRKAKVLSEADYLQIAPYLTVK